jgi:hypothetical protein
MNTFVLALNLTCGGFLLMALVGYIQLHVRAPKLGKYEKAAWLLLVGFSLGFILRMMPLFDSFGQAIEALALSLAATEFIRAPILKLMRWLTEKKA